MRKIITILLLLTSIYTFASKGKVYYVSGDLKEFKAWKEEVDVSVVLDVSKATYMRDYSFKDFLRLYRRERGWETSCLDFFYEAFNEEILYMTACDESPNTKYRILIKVYDVSDKGEISAEIFVYDLKPIGEKEVLHLILLGHDGDPDDLNPMRDPMKDAGEVLGAFLKKIIMGKTVDNIQDCINIKKGKIQYKYRDLDYFDYTKYRQRVFEDIVKSIIDKDGE